MWCACLLRLGLWAGLVVLLAACGLWGNGSAEAGPRRAGRAPLAVSSASASAPARPTAIPRRWDALDCTGQERLLTALAPVTPADRALAQAGVQVLCALRAGRWDLVADFVHPRVGVRLSPDAYLSDDDLHFAAEDLADLPNDPTVWVWGVDPASGRPLALTFAAYAARYVYDGPYWEQGRPALDARQVASTVVDNHTAYFPAARVVEFYLPGTAAYRGLDGRSLRLIFQPGEELPAGLAGTWCLVAIAHDAWVP